MDTPYGPIKIQANRQIAIPKEVLVLLGLKPGERVYVLIDEDSPEVIKVVPAEWVVTRLDRGNAAED